MPYDGHMTATQSASPSATRRILVVDDQPNSAHTLAQTLEQFGPCVEVLIALNAPMALDVIMQHGVDVLITDFKLPGMNGLELIEAVREGRDGLARHIPAHTILITAYADSDVSLNARRLQVDQYLLKPVHPLKLQAIVGEFLNYAPLVRTVQGAASKILIVDDDPDHVKLLIGRLTDEGYHCCAAPSGRAALETLRAETPDLILFDVVTPGAREWEVLAEMRADPCLRHIPAVLITATGPTAFANHAHLRLAADDYVLKPFIWSELSARIRCRLRLKHADDALRRRELELSLLPEFAQDLGACRMLDDVADTTLKWSARVTDADFGHLLILRSPEVALERVYARVDADQRRISERVVERLLHTHQALALADLECHPHWAAFATPSVRSALGVPLLNQKQVVGALVLTHPRAAHLRPDQLPLLQTLASQAILAIESLRLAATEHGQMSDLVASLSHELRNPITTITAYAGLLQKLGPLTTRQLDCLDRIKVVTQHTAQLVTQILDLTHADAASMWQHNVCDMRAVVACLQFNLQAQAAIKQQRLTFRLGDDLPPVLGDAHQLGLVLTNLIENAIKYTPVGGEITVSAERQGETVRLQVCDNGIPPEELPHIFDRFYRVRCDNTQAIEGNGLGLAIVKSIVERHAGSVAAESTPGQGSCFIVTLPGLSAPRLSERGQAGS